MDADLLKEGEYKFHSMFVGRNIHVFTTNIAYIKLLKEKVWLVIGNQHVAFAEENE